MVAGGILEQTVLFSDGLLVWLLSKMKRMLNKEFFSVADNVA